MSRVWSIIKRRRQAALRNSRPTAGFLLIELLLAVTIFATITTALIGALVYGQTSNANAGDRAGAVIILDEGEQAVANMRNAAFANLTVGTHGLMQSGGVWAFNGSTTDTTGVYTRTVVIAANGANRVTATITVTWPELNGTNGSVSASNQFTAWAATIKLWSNAIAAGGVPASGTNNGAKVDTQGKYAYEVMTATTNNFVVLDISNFASPTVVATLSVSNTPTNVFVAGNTAYVTTNTSADGLVIIDISTPTTPTILKNVTLPGAVSTNGVYVSGNYAYLARSVGGGTNVDEFTVVDISNPSTATFTAGYDAGIQMNEVYVSGNFAYVATSSTTNEMVVVNITTPTSPGLYTTYNPATALSALTIAGFGHTILLGMSTTLDVINIPNLAAPAPARLTTFTAASTINDVDVDITNTIACMATASTSGEFQVVNLVGSPISSVTLAKTINLTNNNTGSGVIYNSTYDVFAGASSSNTQSLAVITRN